VARPSANRAKGVRPEPFNWNSRVGKGPEKDVRSDGCGEEEDGVEIKECAARIFRL
jgi:hypothetical protein